MSVSVTTTKMERLSIANDAGLTIDVTIDGQFEIADRALDWIFSGRAGRTLSALARIAGRDVAGCFQEIGFDFRNASNKARRGTIRLYQSRRLVLFRLEFPEEGRCGEAFPVISGYPRKLSHLTYTDVFGGFSFTRFGPDGPWIFFDRAGNSFIFSPAAHFLNTALRRGPHGELRSEVVCSEKLVPSDFCHTSVLAIAPGINRAIEDWGRFLTDVAGKVRPANDADIGLDRIGYWTDRGAKYYYRFEPGLGYGATLLAIRDSFRGAGIRLGYMQLDSWFYPKGRRGLWRCSEDLGGGTYRYEASDELFPKGLRAFQHELALPLITHNRWIDAKSPYRGRYSISGNVSVDPALWTEWMRYLRQSGVRTYEQDWLSGPAQPKRSLDAGESFFDLMAQAAAREGITLQYCMPLPRHFLQGTKYSNLTTIRTSGDRLTRRHWASFLFNGRLATALGEWPWADVFMSAETDNLLLATLSGGMVGVGDAIGQIDADSLLRAVRADGVIVKPDTPLTPLDETYIAYARDCSAPIVALARTDHGGWTTTYILAFGSERRRGTERLALAELGYDGPVYAYDPFRKSGIHLAAGACLAFSVSDRLAYRIIVPVGKSAIGFLGDQRKFVSNGRKRIAHISDDGRLVARVLFGEGEDQVRLHGFAQARPELEARGGRVENLTFIATTGLFTFDLVAREATSPEIAIRIARK